jgi:hypothetical protein
MLVVAKSRHTRGNLDQSDDTQSPGVQKSSHQQADCTSFISRRVVEYLKKWPYGGHNRAIRSINWSCYEEEDHEKDEAGEDTNSNASNHNFWAFNCGVGNFFDHYTVSVDITS